MQEMVQRPMAPSRAVGFSGVLAHISSDRAAPHLARWKCERPLRRIFSVALSGKSVL
jgi:hypothetical protein